MNTSNEITTSTKRYSMHKDQHIAAAEIPFADPIDSKDINRLRIDLQVLQDDNQRYHNKLTHIHTLTPEQRQDYTEKLAFAEA